MGHQYWHAQIQSAKIDSNNVNKQKTARFGSCKRTAWRCPSWQRVV